MRCMVEWLSGGVAWRVLQTTMAVVVYGLIVNVFYEVISKRRMFARKADVEAEIEIETKIKEARDAAIETKGLAKQAIRDPDAKVAIVAAASQTKEATEAAQQEIKRQIALGPLWQRELKALVLVPLVGFLFFMLLALNLVFLGSQRPPIEIFGLSMAIVLAVRLASYISEPTAHDMAKMLPLALLGFYLVDGNFAGIWAGNEALFELVDQWSVVLNFLVLLTVVEVGMRLVYLTVRKARWDAWLRKRAGH